MSEQSSFNQLIPINIKELPTSEKVLTFNNDIGNMAFAKKKKKKKKKLLILQSPKP